MHGKEQQKTPLAITCRIEDGAHAPHYASIEAAGADVRAYLDAPITIQPGESALISSGVSCEIPPGYEIQVRPRSGLAYKHQITILNTPGTIDSDYRGVIGIILINHGKTAFEVTPGMRIAQFVVAPVVQAAWMETEAALACTERGSGGFGHTGTH
ncbi:MAG: dUTP diphosphatase [Chlamydiia bacterium]|nr:dUTP diphosphatase [Chlamydiia bacterium]